MSAGSSASRRAPTSTPRSRHNLPAQAAAEDAASGVLQLAEPESGATMAPSELTLTAPGGERAQRTTPAYAHGKLRPATEPTRPDTRYSVTRARVRDEVTDVANQ